MAIFNELGYGVPYGDPGSANTTFGASQGKQQEMAYGTPSPSNIYLDVLNELNAVIGQNRNTTILPTITRFGTLSTSNAYFGATLARNGNLYCFPYNATNVLEINPSRRLLTTFGSVSNAVAKYAGGALGQNGKIYGAPLLATTVLEIDPDRRIVSTFGNTTGFGYQAGAVTLPNGTILCSPNNGGSNNTALLINPQQRTISRFISPPAGTQLPQSISIGLHPLGIAVCGPQTSNTILTIDVNNKTYTTGSGPLTPTNGDWNGTALAGNGNIYFVPTQNPTNILEYDPYRKVVSFFGSIGSAGTIKFGGAALGPDGAIYTAGNTAFIARIDVYKRTITTFGSISGQYRGIYLALNGKMYLIPLTANPGTYELDFTHLKQFSNNLTLSTYLNNY